jgi:hypothetical protein
MHVFIANETNFGSWICLGLPTLTWLGLKDKPITFLVIIYFLIDGEGYIESTTMPPILKWNFKF